MNTSHYLSLELCKRLTEAGFPETEENCLWYEGEDRLYTLEEMERLQKYACPSIAELLDELPEKIFYQPKWKWNDAFLCITKDEVWYYGEWHSQIVHWTPPNALAEMWLWLKENNYLK